MNKIDTLHSSYLGTFLGLAEVTDSQIAILGPEYVITRLREIREEFLALVAALKVEG